MHLLFLSTNLIYFSEPAIPGIDKNDLKIDINKDVITVSSEIKNESEEDKDGILSLQPQDPKAPTSIPSV